MDLIVNSISSSASLFGFILALHLLWKETHVDEHAKKRWAIRYIAIATVCAALVCLAAFQLKESITTFKQSGAFTEYNLGEASVYYAVPYKTHPFLTVFPRDDASHGLAEIVEERPDGFKVFIGASPESIQWKAEGIPLPQSDP